MKMVRSWPLAVVVTLALASGCGSSDDGGSNAGDKPKASNAPKATKPDNCEKVSAAMVKAIGKGAETGTGMKGIRGAAVLSPDFSNVHFIAVEFSATGVDNQVGVWASNSLEPGGGIIMAVDGFAQQFTDWPDADSTSAAISKADPSVDDAKNCL